MQTVVEYWPVLGVAIFIFGFFALLKAAANHYVKASPSEALVVYGGGAQAIVVGGAKLVIPFMHKYDRLDLRAFQLEPEVHNVASKEKVPVNVSAIATVRISSEADALKHAAARFLGKSTDEIKHIVLGIITPALRGVVADMTIVDLIENRQSFATKVAEHIKTDLGRMGIEVDSLQIGNIGDNYGVIESLGQEEAAKAKTKAAIGVAQAEQDRATQVAEADKIKAINVAEAKRESDVKSSEALRVGEIAKANASAAIEVAKADADQTALDAQRALATIQAKNDAIVQAEQAKIPIIAQKAKTEEQKTLNQVEVEAQQSKIEAETKLQGKARELAEAKAQAEIIVPAQRKKDSMLIEAEGEAAANVAKAEGNKAAKIIDANAKKEADVIEAQGVQQARVEQAKGEKEAIELDAQAEKFKQLQNAEAGKLAAIATADGRKAQAEAQKTEMLAKADGELASLTAQANGKKLDLLAMAEGDKARRLAEAEGEKARLLAQAEGVLRHAKALQELNATGQMLEVLDRLAPIILALGNAARNAGEGIVAPVGDAIGKGLANIKNLNVVDFGGGNGHANGNGHGGSAMERFATSIPGLVVKSLNTVDMMGLLSLAQQFVGDKIDLSKVMAGLIEAGMAVRPAALEEEVTPEPAEEATPVEAAPAAELVAVTSDKNGGSAATADE